MAGKLWDKGFEPDKMIEEYTVGDDRELDMRLARYDVQGSLAHIAMLETIGLLTREELEKLTAGLKEIAAEIEAGRFEIEPGTEDVHSQVELMLTRRLGDAGKKIHSGRSRNDQVALDLRMYLKDEINALQSLVLTVIQALHTQAVANKDAIMPGYTHLQRAQPITFGQQLLAYAMMLERDYGRLTDAYKRTDTSPIGCCALAGTTYPTDRVFEAQKLGFAAVCENSLDGVSDRDFCVELMSACALVMMHLSRLSEELILWSSWEFQFIELDSGFTTGSSIMPQKKNPDITELIRGKTARVYGDLQTLFVMMKGTPLAYNKDMQEDKEGVFDAVDTLKMCLPVFTRMVDTMTINKDNMRNAARKGFMNATDAADWLVKQGVPFRDAHAIIGQLVLYSINNNKNLDDLTLDEYKAVSDVFTEDIYKAIDLDTCVNTRTVPGGPSEAYIKSLIELNKKCIENLK